jgi:hypothetical protein
MCCGRRAILILAAKIGYNTEPPFPITAPGQLPMDERIAYEMKRSGALHRAVVAEGLSVVWGINEKAKI